MSIGIFGPRPEHACRKIFCGEIKFNARDRRFVEVLLLQDFTTVRGTSSTLITQPSYAWLDLGDLEDVVLYTDCRETTPNANLVFETAPAPIDSAFIALVPQFTLATGLRTDAVFSSFANVPVSRYLRWKLSGTANPWDATFRVLVAAYGWS